jgi:hypothetical protein
MLLSFTVGLIAAWLLRLHNFVEQGKEVEMAQKWSTGVIGFFLTVVVLGYIITVYLLSKNQLAPWYQWWCRSRNVHLLIEPCMKNTDNLNAES